MNLTAHRCLKQKKPNQSQYTNSPPSIPICSSHIFPRLGPQPRGLAPPAASTQTGCQPGPCSPHIWSQNICRIHPVLSILAAPASAQTPNSFPQVLYQKPPNQLPTSSWLSFSPAPTPPQHCGQSNLSETKSDYVTSLFRTFVSQIKCKILPRTYKVLYYPASNYLPSFIRGRGPHISHEANGATWKFPNSASLSAQNAILSFAHLANSHSFFF